MCGRTTSCTSPGRIAEIFDAEPAAGLDDRDGPTWNIGPTCTLFGLTVAAAPSAAAPGCPGRLVLDGYRWGLIPAWAEDASPGSRLFNARSETVATKPAFRHAFRSRRLAVVVDGFFEWRRGPGGRGQPFYFRRSAGLPITFAGLWETWHDPIAGTSVRSCTIVTTVAGADMEGVHDRMPVVLERHQLGRWVSPG
ncbi:MAG: SOS response-associated peptidase, partial [Acidimicrobiales bacterium]